MTKRKSGGSWRKERASGRKYSGGDSHPAPKPHKRQQFWVSAYTRRGRNVRAHYRSA